MKNLVSQIEQFLYLLCVCIQIQIDRRVASRAIMEEYLSDKDRKDAEFTVNLKLKDEGAGLFDIIHEENEKPADA